MSEETEVNEPEKFHIADWIAEATITLLAMVGTALAEWIRRTRKAKRDAMESRVKQLEDDWKVMKELQAKQTELIAVAETNIANINVNFTNLKIEMAVQTKLLHDILLKCSK